MKKNRSILLELLSGYPPKCQGCGKMGKLYIHHKLGNGNEDRAKNPNWRLYGNYVKNPNKAKSELMVVCYWCHQDEHAKMYAKQFDGAIIYTTKEVNSSG